MKWVTIGLSATLRGLLMMAAMNTRLVGNTDAAGSKKGVNGVADQSHYGDEPAAQIQEPGQRQSSFKEEAADEGHDGVLD